MLQTPDLPARLSFHALAGAEAQGVTLRTQPGSSATANVEWRSLSVVNVGTMNAPQGTTFVQVRPAKLAPGDYSAEIKIAPSGTVIPVSLHISATGLPPGQPPSPALRALIEQAENELQTGPLSVMHKKLTPSSGDKHDYMSVGPYWWPDPSKPNGLPYIRKDGERNPERNDDRTDSTELHKIFGSTFTLMLAYRETHREEFAKHAAELLRGWFLEPATRMNPNLNFGQAVPGVVEGRGTGIIDTAGLVEVTRGLPWLEKSPSWTVADQAGMKKWFGDYLNWLQTSKNGKEERDAKNNHGTWYDAQLVALALATGQNDLAKRTLEAAKKTRIDAEIKEDGSQPLELARTKSFAYSLMNLRAFFELAEMGQKVGVDLWSTRVRLAIDYLAPYGERMYGQPPMKKWPQEELDGVTRADQLDLLALLRRASTAYRGVRYDHTVCGGSGADVTAARFQILWPLMGDIECH